MNEHEWIEQVRIRNLNGILGIALDIIEPLGPLGAQLLWIAQPVMGLLGAHNLVGEIARMVETPEGIAQLRQMLDEDVT